MQAQPTEAVFDSFICPFDGAFLVGIFNAQHELAAMSAELSSEARGELSDYARVSIEDGRPEELLGMLQSAGEVEEARKAAEQAAAGEEP